MYQEVEEKQKRVRECWSGWGVKEEGGGVCSSLDYTPGRLTSFIQENTDYSRNLCGVQGTWLEENLLGSYAESCWELMLSFVVKMSLDPGQAKNENEM